MSNVLEDGKQHLSKQDTDFSTQNETFPLPPPPPQPPPPPPPSLPPLPEVPSLERNNKNAMPTSTPYDTFFSSPEQEAKKAYQIFIRDKMLTKEDFNSFVFISSYDPVKPVIQNGPLCGMVALSMASDLLSGETVLTDDIFAEAKKAGYSIQGEMFSAYSMQELAGKVLHRPVQLLSLKCQDAKPDCLDGRELLKALVDGHCLLVPYDADKNHGPCLANGHKAHWALITGFFAAFTKSSLPEIQQWPLELDKELSFLYHWKGIHTDKSLKDKLINLFKLSELYVFAHQGKSKYCGIWKFDDLLSSNNNLFEAGPDRDSSDYIIPARGIGEDLRAKVVLIQNEKR